MVTVWDERNLTVNWHRWIQVSHNYSLLGQIQGLHSRHDHTVKFRSWTSYTIKRSNSCAVLLTRSYGPMTFISSSQSWNAFTPSHTVILRISPVTRSEGQISFTSSHMVTWSNCVHLFSHGQTIKMHTYFLTRTNCVHLFSRSHGHTVTVYVDSAKL